MDTPVLYEALRTFRTTRILPRRTSSVVLVYLGRRINPDGYDGSVRGLANFTNLANFEPEGQL
jgi:hypothetical protein